MFGKHKSLDKKLKKNIQWLSKQQSVSKIVIGFSENCRHKYPPGFIRFKKNTTGGIKVNGYSGKGVTDIFIKVDPIYNRKKIVKKIFDYF